MKKKSETRDVYDAVADPTRRKILDLLANVEEMPLYELTTHFQIGRTAVSKHLTILKDAGLVISRKVGRETRYHLNAAPLQEIKDWITYYTKFWNEKIMLLQQLLQEEEKMHKISLDFQINSSIDRVWLALTDSKILSKWVMDNDFKPIVGHKFQFRAKPNKVWDGIVDSEVLVVEQPNKLSYTWRTAGECTTVTWTLKEVDETTLLHLEQSGFEKEGHAYYGAKQGWVLMWGKLEQVLTEL